MSCGLTAGPELAQVDFLNLLYLPDYSFELPAACTVIACSMLPSDRFFMSCLNLLSNR